MMARSVYKVMRAPLAVHRVTHPSQVLCYGFWTFLCFWAAVPFMRQASSTYPAHTVVLAKVAFLAVHSNRRSSLYAPGDLWGEGGEFHLLEIEHLISCVTAP